MSAQQTEGYEDWHKHGDDPGIQAGNDNPPLTEQERLQIFKLKRRTTVPLVYHGPLFHESFAEYQVRVYPLTYMDVCQPGFKRITALATSFRLSLEQGNNMVELHTPQDKIRTIMEELGSVQLGQSSVTVEVERREPDLEETDEAGKPDYFPARKNIATFKMKSAYIQQHMKNKSAVNQTDEESSVLLWNLPEKVDAVFFLSLFPLCVACTMKVVADNNQSATLQMQNEKMTSSHLSSIFDFCIDGRAVETSISLIPPEEEMDGSAPEAGLKTGSTTSMATVAVQSLTSTEILGPAGKVFAMSAGKGDPFRVPDGLASKKKVNYKKSPSDIRRNAARKQKLEQRQKAPPPFTLAPPFPDSLRVMGAADGFNRMPINKQNDRMRPGMYSSPSHPVDRPECYPNAKRSVQGHKDAPYTDARSARPGQISQQPQDWNAHDMPPPEKKIKTQARILRDNKRMEDFNKKINKLVSESAKQGTAAATERVAGGNTGGGGRVPTIGSSSVRQGGEAKKQMGKPNFIKFQPAKAAGPQHHRTGPQQHAKRFQPQSQGNQLHKRPPSDAWRPASQAGNGTWERPGLPVSYDYGRQPEAGAARETFDEDTWWKDDVMEPVARQQQPSGSRPPQQRHRPGAPNGQATDRFHFFKK